MVTPQARATFLAPGELTYCLRFGFLMYPQRHGFCSFNFPQQALDGGADDVIADMHGLNSVGLQVTAFAVSGASHRRSTATTTTAQSAVQENFFILKLICRL
jgi:hypothetical protein